MGYDCTFISLFGVKIPEEYMNKCFKIVIGDDEGYDDLKDFEGTMFYDIKGTPYKFHFYERYGSFITLKYFEFNGPRNPNDTSIIVDPPLAKEVKEFISTIEQMFSSALPKDFEYEYHNYLVMWDSY